MSDILSPDDDNGTMPNNVDELREHVVGHRIVKAEKNKQDGFVITLDNGTKVIMRDTDDCCAYTELEAFLLHPEQVEHIITGINTSEGYTTWHIHADMGDVLTLTVGWSAGNPFYYGYGFDIRVEGKVGRIEK